MKKADVIIIGAGVLGCFMARALRRYDLSVQVFEKEPDICCGITRANTGIIYPGYDMAPGSLKARLTVRACREFPKLCETLGIRYQKCGSMMVGFGERAEAVIRKKYEQLALTARSYNKILRVARTIADLDGKELIEPEHFLEALAFRPLDQSFWRAAYE